MTAIMTTDPHRGQPIRHRGVEPAAARLIVVCVHGRGASAADILSVADEVRATDVAYLAPEAAGQTWYPYSFLAPIEDNQPYLDSALGVLAAIVDDLRAQQIPGERVALLGFSQGACLALEFAARRAQRYAAIVAFSGAAIALPGTQRIHPKGMLGTPVFLGCSDVDPHIPLARVQESAALFRALGATVDARIYPGMGHTINNDELRAARALLAGR